MTYKLYKRFQTLLFFLFLSVLILSQFGDKIPLITQNHFLSEAIFYANPILSLSILYLGIYSYKSKIKGKKKTDGPVSLIIIGLFLSLISFGRPVVGLMLMSDTKNEILTVLDHNGIKEEALSLEKKVKARIAAAKYYFLHTGDSIEYFDDNGKKVIYSPSDSVQKDRQDHIQMTDGIEKIAKDLKSIVINMFSIAIISCLCFIFLLKCSKGK